MRITEVRDLSRREMREIPDCEHRRPVLHSSTFLVGGLMIRRILLPLDGSETAECVLPHAQALSRAFDAPLLLLRVVGSPRPASSVESRLDMADAAAYLSDVASRLRGLEVETKIEEGRAAEQILRVGIQAGAELVLLSTHGEGGLTSFGLSGTSYKVVFDGRLSVMLVHPDRSDVEPAHYEKVLVPVDCSRRAEWAVSHACAIARAQKAQVVLAHVVPRAEVLEPLDEHVEARRLSERLSELNREAAVRYLRGLATRLGDPGLFVRPSIGEGEANLAIAVQQLVSAERPGLVVMTAHGAHPSADCAYGGVTLGLLGRGDTPLLVLQDAAAPVRKPEPERGQSRWPGTVGRPA